MAGTAVATKQEHRSRGVVRTDVTLTTDASGAVSATVVGTGFGRLVGVLYDGALDASATVTIADSKSGATLVTLTTAAATTRFFRPTSVITDNAGAAVTAAATAPNVNRDIYVGGKVTVTVAGGGNAVTSVLGLIVDESGVGDLAQTI